MKSLKPALWPLLTGMILLADYVTGDDVILSPLLFFPVALASWFNGKHWGLPLAITAPLVHLSFHWLWVSSASVTEAIANAAVEIFTLSAFAVLIDVVVRQRMEIRVLKEILPTCAWCKKIRDDENEWQEMETYVSKRSGAKFSHTICPACTKKHFGELVP